MDCRNIAELLVLRIMTAPSNRGIVRDEGMVVQPGQLPYDEAKTHQQAHGGTNHASIPIEVRAKRQQRDGQNAIEHEEGQRDLQGRPAQIEMKQAAKAEHRARVERHGAQRYAQYAHVGRPQAKVRHEHERKHDHHCRDHGESCEQTKHA